VKVALMGRSLRGRMSGVVRYTHELVTALAPRLGDDLTVFVTRASDGLDGLPVRRIRAPFRTRTEYARACWEQTVVPVQVARLEPAVYHSPNYILPLAVRCPTVVTVHDLAFLDASLHRLRSHLYLSTLTTLAARHADRVICVSQHTYEQFIDHFPDAADRARVVTEGVGPSFTRQPADAVERFRARHKLPERYILFVGTFEPRKNLARLVDAFEKAVRATDAPDHLVLCGGTGWKNDDVFARIDASPVRDRIRVLGYLADEELASAYSGCSLFAYPSTSEGFGLPPVEAMACGAPVLTSDTGALPETVGRSALTVDPFTTDAIADGMIRLLTDEALRHELVAAGRARAGLLSWDAVAERTLAIYEEIA
jgi:glycosyltransferase involved in cell wall biosynthesis